MRFEIPTWGCRVAGIMAIASFGLGATAAEAQPETDREWKPARTADGQPNLQGVWNYATITPLERPSEFAEKATLTEEEVAAYEQRILGVQDQDRRDGPAARDVERAYNAFWWDRGTQVIETRRTSLIVDPPDGQLPALMPDAQRRMDSRAAAWRGRAAGPEDRLFSERCMFWESTGPPMLPSAYNNHIQILQTADYVVIVNEMIHDARIVPLDGRPHLGPRNRQWRGDSRGRWEGETLVVDTTMFSDGLDSGLGFRGSGEHLHLVERFTRADTNTLLYEFTLEDATTWESSWTAEVPMRKTSNRMYEYACHEGNYGMTNLLAGARNEDRAER